MLGLRTTGVTGVSDYENRTVAIEVTGLCGQNLMRHSHYTVKVPCSRLSDAMQRISRMGGKVASVTLLSHSAALEALEHAPVLEEAPAMPHSIDAGTPSAPLQEQVEAPTPENGTAAVHLAERSPATVAPIEPVEALVSDAEPLMEGAAQQEAAPAEVAEAGAPATEPVAAPAVSELKPLMEGAAQQEAAAAEVAEAGAPAIEPVAAPVSEQEPLIEGAAQQEAAAAIEPEASAPAIEPVAAPVAAPVSPTVSDPDSGAAKIAELAPEESAAPEPKTTAKKTAKGKSSTLSTKTKKTSKNTGSKKGRKSKSSD
ncbi:phycobilisome linker polypeptide [Kamptonema formosum]|uniref:phycobilisome linker polypeptide n=1 Tax=Kamptonema formosum TaxID=331992 RepID=UPI00034CDC91|nr:phycobilisome linker polypeptide [Oscillatoria sp. PCC 10802]